MISFIRQPELDVQGQKFHKSVNAIQCSDSFRRIVSSSGV